MSRRRKKGRARVWMSDDARKQLELAHRGALTNYVIEHGGRGGMKSCRDGFMNAVKRAGITKKVTPHTIRHTLATWLYKGETKLTSQLLGHKDTRTTQLIYTHPDHTETMAVVKEIERKVSN